METTGCDISGAVIFDAKYLDEIRMGSPPAGNMGGIGQNRLFSTDISLYLRNSAREDIDVSLNGSFI